MDKTLDYYSKLTGVEFKEAPHADKVTENEKGKVYDVYNKDGTKLGSLILDLFSRENKEPGASARYNRIAYIDDDGVKTTPIVALRTNITDTGEDNAPIPYTSTTANDYQEVLHELGHALNCLFVKAGIREQNAFAVEWDAAELQSSTFELMVTQKEFLKEVAVNSEGEAIPR